MIVVQNAYFIFPDAGRDFPNAPAREVASEAYWIPV